MIRVGTSGRFFMLKLFAVGFLALLLLIPILFIGGLIGERRQRRTEAISERFAFELPLALRGSLGLYLTPVGESTVVELTSNAAGPSFQGAWLPLRRQISGAGFQARWEIPFLGRNYPQVLSGAESRRGALTGSRFGVEFTDPVDEYRMASRSVKYAALFILLTFGAAYAIASVAVIAMITAYSRSVLGRRALALGVGAGVAVLYAYLYVLLMIEDFALLAGVMFVTRRVNWYAIGTARAEPIDAPAR